MILKVGEVYQEQKGDKAKIIKIDDNIVYYLRFYSQERERKDHLFIGVFKRIYPIHLKAYNTPLYKALNLA